MNIYVGNLAWGMADEDLKSAFEEFGEVTSAVVIKDKFTGRSRGFGFVEMGNQADAINAIRALNETELKGRNIVVNQAKERN